MNKDFTDAMNIKQDEICLLFVEGLGLIIGTVDFVAGGLIINSPRIVQIQQGNPPTISLAIPLGAPKRMFLTKPPIFMYKANEPNLLELYRNTISAIKIVPSIPKNNSIVNLFKGGKN